MRTTMNEIGVNFPPPSWGRGVGWESEAYPTIWPMRAQPPCFLPRHSREGGNPESSFRRNASPFFDWQPFCLEKTHWIPAFAGMTVKLYLLDSKTL
jgi:hypothetical protein